MKIGFSIQSPAMNTRTSDSEKNPYLGGHKNLESLLTFLKSAGVDSIEVRKLDRGDNFQEFKETIQMIWGLGLEITVHGDINGDFPGEKFIEVYPSLEWIINNFEMHQSRLVIPLHAFQALEGNIKELKNRTIETLSEWASIIEEEKRPIYIALENNRNKEVVDPGNSTEGVYDMVRSINSPHVGICWDMGHYYSNLMKKNDLESRPLNYVDGQPSSTFLKSVYHTHIHGLNANGKTHFPLTEEKSLPLEQYITALKNVNYSGVYNLELSLERWGTDTLYDQEIASTIQRLKKTVSK